MARASSIENGEGNTTNAYLSGDCRFAPLDEAANNFSGKLFLNNSRDF